MGCYFTSSSPVPLIGHPCRTGAFQVVVMDCGSPEHNGPQHTEPTDERRRDFERTGSRARLGVRVHSRRINEAASKARSGSRRVKDRERAVDGIERRVTARELVARGGGVLGSEIQNRFAGSRRGGCG